MDDGQQLPGELGSKNGSAWIPVWSQMALPEAFEAHAIRAGLPRTATNRPAVQPPRGERTGTLDAAQRRQLDGIFRSNERFLRSLAQRLCRSSFEPGDLVQDTLERCTRRGRALLSVACPRAWMARVMRNLFIDRVRRCHGCPAVVPFDDQAPLPTAERRAWWEDLDAADVRAGLHEVASQHRRAFELFAFKGCSYSEIASHLGITPATVGTRILRARRQLKQIIAARHDHGRSRPEAMG